MDLHFDPTQQQGEYRAEWQPLPEGVYLFVIDNAEEVPTKSGSGSYLQLDCKVVGGERDGSGYTIRLNLNNTNPKAVEIARIELREICLASGVMKLTNETQLIGKQFKAKIKVRKRKDDETKMENYITEYGKKKPTAPTPQPAAQQDASAPADGEGADEMW